MNLDQFIAKYTGQSITNNGGTFKGECVSLCARYAQEVQGVPNADSVLYCSNTGGARDLYEQFDGRLPQYYDRIPFGQPRQKGDLVVWGDNLGNYGDVAVALDSGNTVFGQLGTPVFAPARVRVETRQPLGYLRLKGEGEVMPNEGDVQNAYHKFQGRDATPEEVQVYITKPWSAPDGLYYGKIFPETQFLQDSLKQQTDGAAFATAVAGIRGNRLNEIAKGVGARDGDDYDTIIKNIEALKTGGSDTLAKDTNTKVNQLVGWFKSIFKIGG